MNEYLSDREYDDWFFDLGGARDDVIRLLKSRGLGRGFRVLDVAAGHGTLTLKVAQAVREGEVVAAGLANDVRDYKWYRTQVPEGRFSGIVYYMEMDATDLEFEDGRFDFVVNFLGLEDIRMTTGDEGLTRALREMARVTRPGGYVQVAIAVYGDKPDEILLKEVETYIGHGAVFPPPEFLRERMRENRLEMVEELPLVPGRKLSTRQAKEEIRFACEMSPVIFQKYGVRTRDFEEVWGRFGPEIERVGLAHYSRILCLVARKPLG
jgi:ubiquinone/menaquinone biosynthesis C-methylase UbiE